MVDRADRVALEALVFRLITAAAEGGLSAVYGALTPAAIDAIGDAVGSALPPGYRRFMMSFGSLRVVDDDGEVAGFCVYTPREAIEHSLAGAASSSSFKKIAFAAAGARGSWCFDAGRPGDDGELPVRLDGPGGPEYPDFMAWLVGQIEEFCGPSARPSS